MEKSQTFEVEAPVEEQVVDAASSVVNEAEAAQGGLSPEEIAMGKKHGVIKPEAKADEGKKEGDKTSTEEKAGGAEEVVEEEVILPAEAAEEDLDPEKEADLVATYSKNEKSLYWQAKKERIKRQTAQREKEHTAIQLASARRELETLKSGKAKPKAEGEEGAEVVEGEDDEDTRVMTVGEYKKMLKEQNQKRGEQDVKAQETVTRLEQQEAEFKVDHPDFDEVSDLAKEMMDKNKAYAQMMLVAASDPNENAADVVYRIGQLHPKYKKAGTQAEGKDPKDGKKPKNDAEKAITNASKKQTSASVTSGAGGAKRIVAEEDLTVDDVAAMTPADYARLSSKTRERILRESCA